MSNRKFLTNKTVIPYSQIVGAPNTDGFVQGLVAGTNITIDNSDPRHPKISSSGGGGGSGGQVDSVVAGSGISVDSSDPVNPTITNTAPAVLPLSAKGDIYTHDGTGPARFPAGTDGQVVGYDSSTATGLKAVNAGGGVPSGGTTGQIIVKQSATDGDAAWQDPLIQSAGTGIDITSGVISSTLGSIAVTNDVADYASLPTLSAGDAGQYWVTRDTSMAYRWNGSAWPAEGDGIGVGIKRYTTLNPADTSGNVSLFQGNRIGIGKTANAGISRSVRQIIGKKYFEAVFSSFNTAGSAVIAAGVATSAASLSASLGYSTADGWAAWGTSAGARHNGVTAVATTFANGDIVGFYVDQAGGKMWIAKNGTQLRGNPADGSSPIWSDLAGTLYAAACPWDVNAQVRMRFDPNEWYYTPPAGYDAITA